MNALLLVALTGISLLCLHLSPCGAALYNDPYEQRQYLQRRPDTGRQIVHFMAPSSRMSSMLYRRKKEVASNQLNEDMPHFDEATE